MLESLLVNRKQAGVLGRLSGAGWEEEWTRDSTISRGMQHEYMKHGGDTKETKETSVKIAIELFLKIIQYTFSKFWEEYVTELKSPDSGERGR